MNRLALALALLPLCAGCSLQKMAVDQMVPVFVQTKADFDRVSVPAYAREAGPGLIALMNGMVLSSPDNPDLRLIQAELNGSFAFAFLEQDDPVWADFHYTTARRAAIAALAEVDDELAAALESAGSEELAALLAEQDEDAVPALFWWGFARGSQINLHRGEPSAVADLARVDQVMGWVLERDPGFFFGGPHLYFGMRHLALPASLGGDPAKGLKHFEEVDRLTGGKMLLAKVLKAQFYAPTLAATPAGASIDEVLAAQRRAWDAFYGELTAVIDAPDDLWPEQTLTNAVAKQRARALLAHPDANNIIPPEGVENPYAEAAGGGGWGDAGSTSGAADGGDWGDGDWGGD